MRDDLLTLVNDKIIHERVRLLILTYVASSDKNLVAFNDIKNALGLSSGNLSIQLKTLQEAGYIAIKKEFKDNKPLTRVAMSRKGSQALDRYLGEMENLLQHFQKGTGYDHPGY